MLPDVFSNALFVPAHCADTVTSRPKTTAKQGASRSQHITVDTNCALAFQVPNRVGYAVLRWNAEQHMNVVWHSLAFQKLKPTMLAQFPEYLPYPAANLAVKNLSAILRDNDHVILALPFHMCLTLPILHWRSSQPSWGLPREDRLAFSPWVWQSLVNSHRHSRWFSLFN